MADPIPQTEELEARLRFLQEATPLSSLPDDVLRLANAAMHATTHAEGEAIVREGEPGRALYVLVSGRAEVRLHTESGARSTVARVTPGECFGEMSLLSGEPASADVVALEPTRCLALEREALEELVAFHPRLLRALVRLVARRLHTTTAAMANARERGEALARFLREATSGDLTLLGRDRSIRALERKLEELAATDAPALITGERGTGKELVARLIHSHGPRRHGPLLCADCSQIAETVWGDHLFGPHTRGADPTANLSHLELAEGGTLLLKNIEKLPAPIAERLGRFLLGGAAPTGRRPDVRVLVTTAEPFEVLVRDELLVPELERALAPAVVSVPPLRERKRDIPLLAATYLERHARRLGKDVVDIAEAALTRLVSHDYTGANVRELEEVIERAVILAEGRTIQAEEIFLGLTPRDEGWRFNLLRLPKRLVELTLRLYPRPIRYVSAVGLLALVLTCFFGPSDGRQNLGAVLGWAVWWPAMALSFVFAGRAWCAVCPLSVPGSLVQRLVSLKLSLPTWIKRQDSRIAMAGLFLIVLLEELTVMRESPRLTGVLLLVIVACALGCAVLFPRRTWCRHLCPLGGLAGLGATGAVLELRPTRDICGAECQGHDCYRGTARAGGCPMFEHTMFLESNRSCILCLDCVRSCPHGSPQLNLRPPARELHASPGHAAGTEESTALLAGLVVALLALHRWPTALGWPRAVVAAILLTAGAALPLLALTQRRRGLARHADPAAIVALERRATAWLPLVGAGFAAFQLAFVPGLPELLGSLHLGPSPGARQALTFPILAALQLVILLAGAIAAGHTLRQLHLQASASAASRPRLTRSLFALSAYLVVLLGLLLL